MLGSFAVSVVSEKPEGVLRHTLCVIEAGGLDAAEARVMHRLTQAGHRIRGLLSHAVEIAEEALVTSS